MQETIRIADGAFEERLGYKFSAKELLERALTHSSAVPELRSAGAEEAVAAVLPRDNERLEFLGDAVLELLASEYLLGAFPEWSEGQLSKSRARIAESDRKSALQELLQGQGRAPAEYRMAGESGPDHQKVFQIEVWIDGEYMATGEGSTKKEAEQRAARSALDQLKRAQAKG